MKLQNSVKEFGNNVFFRFITWERDKDIAYLKPLKLLKR